MAAAGGAGRGQTQTWSKVITWRMPVLSRAAGVPAVAAATATPSHAPPAAPAGPEGTAPAPRRGWPRRGWPRRGWPSRAAALPWLRETALITGYLAAGIAVTWPRASYLAGRLPALRDAAGYVWGLWWAAHLLTHPGDPWFTRYLAAPVGSQLGYHTLMPLPGLVMAPVTLAFGPSASYNLLSIACPGLLCYAMYRAARLWLPGFDAAAAGAFFGLSSTLAWRSWYQINLGLGALFLPLALAAAVRLTRSPGRRDAVVLGLVLGAAMLTDQESAVLAGLLAALVVVPWLARSRAAAGARATLLALAVAAVTAGPQLAAMYAQASSGGARVPAYLLARNYDGSGAGLVQMFAPSPRLASYGLAALASPYYHGRPAVVVSSYGAVLTVAALAGLAVAWRRRAARRLGLLWLGSTVLALGSLPWIYDHGAAPLPEQWHGVRVSALMPFTWFVRVPGLANFREADRFTELGLVAAALLAGPAAGWLRAHARPLLAVVLALGALEAGWSGNPPQQGPIGVMPTALPRLDGPIAADHSASIVVDVPFGIRGGLPLAGQPFPPETMVLATADGHPLANAFISRIPHATLAGIRARPFYAALLAAQDGRPASPAVLAAAGASARAMHVGWVLVWRPEPGIGGLLHGTGFRLDYRADGVLVYRAAPWAGTSPAASSRSRPRSPAASPSLSSGDRAASTRSCQVCHARQSWPATARPAAVR
jgi:hypothetical protein